MIGLRKGTASESHFRMMSHAFPGAGSVSIQSTGLSQDKMYLICFLRTLEKTITKTLGRHLDYLLAKELS